MRGRLLNPFIAELRQLDTEATAADPDGAGSLTSGYDDDFREVVAVSDGTAAGTSARQEKSPIFVPCQVDPGFFEALQMVVGGDVTTSRIQLCFHFENLENMGLVDPTTGVATIRKGDRLAAIRRYVDNSLIESVPDPPGLYAIEVSPRGFGLIGGERNLLLVTFEERERAMAKGVR